MDEPFCVIRQYDACGLWPSYTRIEASHKHDDALQGRRTRVAHVGEILRHSGSSFGTGKVL
jgi:hypothetical protein